VIDSKRHSKRRLEEKEARQRMCHSLRDRELLAEEAHRPRTVRSRWGGRATQAQRERDEAWPETEEKDRVRTEEEEVLEVVGSVG
jgi:hypothetical protein